jgi:hypothetical protein
MSASTEPVAGDGLPSHSCMKDSDGGDLYGWDTDSTHGKNKNHHQDHKASKQQIWELNPGSLTAEPRS